MEYICKTIEEVKKALSDARKPGDVFICSDEVFEYFCNQPERLSEKTSKEEAIV